jgi:integrase
MAEPLTVCDVITLYRRHCAAEGVHGDSAHTSCEIAFRLFVETYGTLAVIDAKPFHLTDFIESHPEWKSSATKRQRSNAIRAAFNWALKQERIERNPFRNVRYAEAERRQEMPDDVLEAVKQGTNKPTEKILTFIRLTGCRASEACSAMRAHVDLEAGTWTMPHDKTRKHRMRPKIVALIPEAVALIHSVLAGRDGDGLPIFLNSRRRPFTRHNLWMAVNNCKRREGIECKAAVHGLRHAFATRAIANGATAELVAAQMGHSNPQTVMKWYAHLNGQMNAVRAAASLGAPKKLSA